MTTELYLLPATCDTVVNVMGLNASGEVLTDFLPLERFRSWEHNYGYELNGPYLRLRLPSAGIDAITARVRYRPGGFFAMHYVASGYTPTGSSTTTFELAPTSSTTGFHDTRANGYIGGWCRIIGSTSPSTAEGDERFITNFTNAGDGTLTVSPAFTAIGYEVVPTVDPQMWEAIVLDATRFYASIWGRRTRAAGIDRMYAKHIRSVRLAEATADAAQEEQFGDLGRGTQLRTGRHGRRLYH